MSARYFAVRDGTQVGLEVHVWPGGTRFTFEEDRGLGVFTVDGKPHEASIDVSRAELGSWLANGWVVEREAPKSAKRSRSASGGLPS